MTSSISHYKVTPKLNRKDWLITSTYRKVLEWLVSRFKKPFNRPVYQTGKKLTPNRIT